MENLGKGTGLSEQIQNTSAQLLSEVELHKHLKSLILNTTLRVWESDDKPILIYTGLTGKLTWSFSIIGRKKLPRKLKKKIFKTKKLRLLHIPQYYKQWTI
jgi:hypothetical protein